MHLAFFGHFDFGLGGWILVKAIGQCYAWNFKLLFVQFRDFKVALVWIAVGQEFNGLGILACAVTAV